MVKHIILSEDWQIKERNPAYSLLTDREENTGWIPARVPGTVHEALLAAGIIPDPFYALNEHKVQWVGERDWWYRTVFHFPEDWSNEEQFVLCFDGLDTFATVWLNGVQIASSENMFVSLRVPVTSLLSPDRNELVLLFEAALPRGKALEAEYGKKTAWCDGDPSRVYARKAQYHYGWDWGPVLLTTGPWRPIRLETYQARITDLHYPVEVSADLTHATITLDLEVEASPASSPLQVHLELYGPDQTLLTTNTLPLQEDGYLHHTFEIDEPELWWPCGYGKQVLYQMSATIYQGDKRLDQQQIRLGIRRLRLLQEPVEGEEGRSFLFEVNNTPIFCGGANWIPADVLLPRITAERYRAYLEMAAQAHMTMIRVWGGGIYEDDLFYDLCDELGLLVWQDFMFSCGIYPVYPAFLDQVHVEAQYQIKRLRNHPSLALWCGNNENQMIAAVTRQATHENGQLLYPDRAIYEDLLARLCAQLDPSRPYWAGSPFGGNDPNDSLLGDRHTWEIWHGNMAPYQDYHKFSGRFVSEFGMEAAPSIHTLLSVIPAEERYPQSRSVEHHNKSADGTRRLAVYLSDNLAFPHTLAEYVYATQFIQAEALAYAIRGWRRRFGRSGRRSVAGALVWQLNDCWPGISWAIIDSMQSPKPAYYTMRRELAPLALGLTQEGEELVLWGVSSLPHAISASIQIDLWGFDGTLLSKHTIPVHLTANSVTEAGSYSLSIDVPHVVSARLTYQDEIVARATLWPEPFKYAPLQIPEISIERLDAQTVRLRTQRPAKGVWLSADEAVRWRDNMLDLLPNDPQIIKIEGYAGNDIHVTWLRNSFQP